MLVVERDPGTAGAWPRCCGGGGYRVLPARGGEEALEVAARHEGPVDLLITGVMLGGLNGAELSARLRRARPGLRTLFVVEDAGGPIRGSAPGRRGLARPPAILGRDLLEKVAHALPTAAPG